MMQICPHRSLLCHRPQRGPDEAAKYVRTEYRDTNPSWLLAEGTKNGQVRMDGEQRKPLPVGRIAAELPSHVLMRDGSGADR